MTEQIKNLMERLDISEAEAKEMLADDEAIDKGEKLFELSAEQKKVVKKACSTGTRKTTAYTFTKRERKPNEEKRFLIAELEKSIQSCNATDITITNIERQIDFSINGTKYRIVLSAPRS